MVLWQDTGLASQFKMVALENNSEKLLLELVSIASDVRCPVCHGIATRVHSKYTRTLRDLPCLGKPLQLLLHLRKFFCDWPTCRRKIFTERLDTLATPWAKLTNRLVETITNIGLATCGRLGSRLAGKLGILTSRHTILRRVKQLPSLAAAKVKLLGIDDFSYKRGRRFGTILVDLEQHMIIDILADRKVETVVAWLKMHPEIEVVSRDRGTDYAKAARLGAPQAVQVADRFHIVKNLAEAVETVLIRHWSQIKKKGIAPSLVSPKGHRTQRLIRKAELLSQELAKPTPTTSLEKVQQQRYLQRLESYAQVIKMVEEGYSSEQIAQQLGVTGRTIRRWLVEGSPTVLRRAKPSELDRYVPYLMKRWEEGCQNISQLWRELQAQGYNSTYAMVFRFVKRLKAQEKAHKDVREIKPATAVNMRSAVAAALVEETVETKPFPLTGNDEDKQQPNKESARSPVLSVKSAIWLFVKAEKDLAIEEQADLKRLCRVSSELAQLHELVQKFQQMQHERTGTAKQLKAWCKEVHASGIAELISFVKGVEKDEAAVIAGLTFEHNNGQVEGQNTKLKLVKRIMYGQADVELLRKRLVHTI